MTSYLHVGDERYVIIFIKDRYVPQAHQMSLVPGILHCESSTGPAGLNLRQ